MDLNQERSIIKNLQANGFDRYLVDCGYDKILDDNKKKEI